VAMVDHHKLMFQ